MIEKLKVCWLVLTQRGPVKAGPPPKVPVIRVADIDEHRALEQIAANQGNYYQMVTDLFALAVAREMRIPVDDPKPREDVVFAYQAPRFSLEVFTEWIGRSKEDLEEIREQQKNQNVITEGVA